MSDILDFLSFLLLEIPARALQFFVNAPFWGAGLAVALVVLVLLMCRSGRRRR